jgi:hypothetical protein
LGIDDCTTICYPFTVTQMQHDGWWYVSCSRECVTGSGPTFTEALRDAASIILSLETDPEE